MKVHATGERLSRGSIAASLAIVLRFWLALSSPSAWAAGTNETPKPDNGFRYTNDVMPEIPLSIHVIEIERGRADLKFCTTLGEGHVIGMGTVSQQIKAIPAQYGRPLGAINGDFYDKNEKEEGRPRDLQIRFGEVVSSPAGHVCFWIAPDGAPRMTNVFSRFRVVWANGKTTPIGLNQLRQNDSAVLYTALYGASTRTTGGVELVIERGTNAVWLPLKASQEYAGRVREVREGGSTALAPDIMVLSLGPSLSQPASNTQVGATVRIITETVPDMAGVDVAIGGGPMLVQDGKPKQWPGFIKLRHPRAAMGFNKDHFFLVEVDGRQRDISIGMTFPELADYMVKLGCEQAMNFDGGGSATLWAFGRVQNSPSEGEERPSPNALVVLKKPASKP